jgi:hypothetical protein
VLALGPLAAPLAVPDVDAELADQRGAGDLGLVLVGGAGLDEAAPAVRAGLGQERLVALGDLLGRGRRAVAVGAVGVARLPTGRLGIGLNQLSGFQRGTLNSGKTAITGTVARSQSFATDAVGNFTGVTTNGTTQSRTANAQNEVTGISGATTPTYDSNGNMTGDETGRQFAYDAWNRLVVVKNSGGTTLESFTYDGLPVRRK